MTTDRLEVRVDKEQQHRLETLAEKNSVPVSKILRRIIERTYDTKMIEYRMQILREMASLNLEHVPDPEELSRQLDRTYDIDDLH